MKTGVIIQARLGSTRLPKKILMPLPYSSNKTVLEQVIYRVKNAHLVDEIIIATTNLIEDEPIVGLMKKIEVKYYRGSSDNVLARFYNAAKENNLDIVVRITSDCPCVDPNIIDNFVSIFKEEDYDYVANILSSSYPRGLDVEVFSFEALSKAFFKAISSYDKEHVTPFICNNPYIFKLKNIEFPSEVNLPNVRITVDTYEDYMLICSIYDYLYKEGYCFCTKDIISLYNKKPWLYEINKEIQQKKEFDTSHESKQEVLKILEYFNMNKAKEIIEKYFE